MDNQKLSIKPHNGYGFVYKYTSPSGKIYIGKTKTTLKERAKNNAKGYKGCPYFYRAIEKYGWENFEVEILEEVPLEILNEAELDYITKYNSTDRNIGYNISTEETKYVYLIKRIPVYCYNSETGAFIERFESAFEAEKTIGVHRGSIRKALNKPDHVCKDMLWKTEFFEKVEPLIRKPQKHYKKVYIYDAQTGNFLMEYDSIREAARETGYNRSTIQEQLSRSKVKKSKKYIFRLFKVDNLFDESSTTIPQGSKLKQAETETIQ